MELLDKNLIIEEIPLFADLLVRERRLIRERSEILEYKKGEVVYLEGSAADAFYCVILGRIVIYTRGSRGEETVLEYLHRGKYFGIISLLTGDPHSVTAKALNDCTLLVIKKEDFAYLLKEAPKMAVGLSLSLSRRLKNKDLHQKVIFESTIISVFSSYSHAGKTIYALNLALGLRQEAHKSVIILDLTTQDKLHSLPKKMGVEQECPVLDLSAERPDLLNSINDFKVSGSSSLDLVCLNYLPEDELCVKRLLAILSTLVNDYHYIILDLPSSMDPCIFKILNQSDLIHILTSPEQVDLRRTHNLVTHLKKEFDFPESKIKVIINEYKRAKLDHNEQTQLLEGGIFATLPRIELGEEEQQVIKKPDSEYAKAIRRISRQVSDSFVGLALGVGVGYGFCHIGVLKVIEEEKIPIDVISGASIGALIASLWATGRSADQILEITQEFRQPNYIWSLIDFTFPTLGFIKGNKLYKFLKKYFGNRTFYDIRLPLKIIASDVQKKESRVFDKGPLVDAIMASCSMPGVFRPFHFREGLLLDGGIINPLPTEVLFKMGVRKIIAVNVTPSREDILNQYSRIKEQLSVTYTAVKKREWFSLKKYLKEKLKTNILDIIFSSIEVMQSEMVQREAQLADIVLHPDTSGMHWLELHRSKEFAQKGEEETRRNLARIWAVINE